MGLLTRQREKHINVKQFGQAATLTERISQLRAKKKENYRKNSPCFRPREENVKSKMQRQNP